MKKTLLLADDSPTIQKVINLTFADEGIDVISVSDGNAAIQQLREVKPDLVMADVHMPGLNGYQICERIRQNAELSKVPVILLVGSFEPFDEDEAIRVGADDFLMKPFQSIRQLVSRVAALLETPAEVVAQDVAAEEPVAEQIAEEESWAEEATTEIPQSAVAVEPSGPEHISDVPDAGPEVVAEIIEAAPEVEAGPSEITAVSHTEEVIHITGSDIYSSITPQDVFHSPWTDAPKVEETAKVETPAVHEIAEATEVTDTVTPMPAQTLEVTSEVDELDDFDIEFGQKFPDAAELSSPSVSVPALEPVSFENDIADTIHTSQSELDIPPAENIEETVVEEAAPVWDANTESTTELETNIAEFPVAETTEEEAVAEHYEITQPEIESNVTEYPFAAPAEQVVSEEQISKEIDQYVAEQFPEEQFSQEASENEQASETIFDKELATGEIGDEVTSESDKVAQSPVSTLDYSIEEVATEVTPELAENTVEGAVQRIAAEEQFESVLSEEPPVRERVTEESAEDGKVEDFSVPQFTEAANYDFRSPDAFDDDAGIEEQFRGLKLSIVEEPQSKPEPVAVQIPETEAVAISEPDPDPLELKSVTDAEPSEVSVDQADGFSAATPSTEAPRTVTADDIEAIAQRVSEKLLEKLVRNLAPDMKDLIIEEISGNTDKKE